MKILLAEDDQVHEMLFREFFKKINPDANITNCKRFVSFKGLIEAEEFDLYVLDHNLECYTAFRYIEEIRAVNSRAKIVVLSASFDGVEREKLESLGAKTMKKTGDVDEFVETMREVLSGL